MKIVINVVFHLLSAFACFFCGCVFCYGWESIKKTSRPLENVRAQALEDLLNGESCPVCGYYCLGKGGLGCIDKPSMESTEPAPAPSSETPDHHPRQAGWDIVPTDEKLEQPYMHHMLGICSCLEGIRCPWLARLTTESALQKHSTQTDSQPVAPSKQTSSRRTVIQPNTPYGVDGLPKAQPLQKGTSILVEPSERDTWCPRCFWRLTGRDIHTTYHRCPEWVA